jgi:hypothetical protein
MSDVLPKDVGFLGAIVWLSVSTLAAIQNSAGVILGGIRRAPHLGQKRTILSTFLNKLFLYFTRSIQATSASLGFRNAFKVRVHLLHYFLQELPETPNH